MVTLLTSAESLSMSDVDAGSRPATPNRQKCGTRTYARREIAMPKFDGDIARCIKCGQSYVSPRRTARICASCTLRRSPRPASPARKVSDAIVSLPGDRRTINAGGERQPAGRRGRSHLSLPAGFSAPVSLTPNVALTHEPSFLESCLPRTIALALKHKRRLLAELVGPDEAWPFPDRVLVWLAEHWRENVEAYHRGSAPAMAGKLQSHQLERLDQHYYDSLRSRIRRLRRRE